MFTSRRQIQMVILTTILLIFSTAVFSNDQIWMEKAGGRTPLVNIPSIAPLVKNIEGAVLFISVESDSVAQEMDPRIEMFKRFGFEFEIPKHRVGQGSGFLIHPRGYALTNYHVVEGADKIWVSVGGAKEKVAASVVGTDPRTDVALIKLDGAKDDWPYIPLGDSDRLQVGDFVVAMGNPFGLAQTVSSGIISAKSRRNVAPSGRQGLYDFLQTDAAINPGNSGGPLINLVGEVIGINSAINAAGQGIGFAIPINFVKKMIPELYRSGRVTHGWIGIELKDLSTDLAKAMGVQNGNGALVVRVAPSSPAYKAGIKPGDVIVKFDNTTVEDADGLRLIIANSPVNKNLNLEVIRDNELRSTSVVLSENKQFKQNNSKNIKSESKPQNEKRLGLRFEDLTEPLRERLQLPQNISGAIILQVEQNLPAEEADLRPGDVVTHVNGKMIQNGMQFARSIQSVKSGKVLKLTVFRQGETAVVMMIQP